MRARVIPVALASALLGVPAGWGAYEATTAREPAPAASAPASPSAAASATAAPTYGAAPDYAGILASAPVVAGQRVHGVVVDVQTGKTLATSGGEATLPPASSLKVISAAAILKTLDPEQRLTTSVTRTGPGALTLTGTGDVMLGSGKNDDAAVQGRAGLGTLAQQVAVQLAKGAVPAQLALTADDSLFPEALNPAWPDGDIATGQMTRLSPFAVASGFVNEESLTGQRVSDPALTAADAFARALTAELAAKGHTVSISVARGKGAGAGAGSGAAVLGSVQSAPVKDQLAHALVESDNYAIEALARVAAVKAGKPATAAGVAQLIRGLLPEITEYPGEIRAVDASGLSADNTVTPRAMASAVKGLVSSPVVALRGEAGGLPVAGLTGTLAGRFGGESAAGARGLVLAKTGTLNATSVLAGYATGPDGRTVAFSLTYNGIEGSLTEAKAAIDTVAARFVTD